MPGRLRMVQRQGDGAAPCAVTAARAGRASNARPQTTARLQKAANPPRIRRFRDVRSTSVRGRQNVQNPDTLTARYR